MRIVVIAHGLRVAGGKSVALNIVKSLLKQYPHHEYLLFVPLDDDYKAISYSEKCCVHYFPVSNFIKRALYDYIFLKNKISGFKPDVIWGLGNLGVAKPSCNQVILLHKAQLVSGYRHRVGETRINKLKNYIIKNKLKKCLAGTQLIFCQTKVMKNNFLNTFAYDGEVSLFPNAVSVSIDSVDVDFVKKFKDSYRDKKRFLVLTRYYPHKNLELLVECFQKYRDELKDVVCFLTISKAEHQCAGKLLDQIDQYNLNENIVNLGPIRQSDLAKYYGGCDALLLPTLLESFSGTYLEAMRYGTPIITSDLDFAHEICGDSAIYFDPYDEDSLKQRLLEFCDSGDESSKLIAEGEKQLNNYVRSWDEIVHDGMIRIEAMLNKNN